MLAIGPLCPLLLWSVACPEAAQPPGARSPTLSLYGSRSGGALTAPPPCVRHGTQLSNALLGSRHGDGLDPTSEMCYAAKYNSTLCRAFEPVAQAQGADMPASS